MTFADCAHVVSGLWPASDHSGPLARAFDAAESDGLDLAQFQLLLRGLSYYERISEVKGGLAPAVDIDGRISEGEFVRVATTLDAEGLIGPRRASDAAVDWAHVYDRIAGWERASRPS